MRILLAIDGSSHSESAVEAVRSRPWPRGSVVRVLSVVPDSIPPPPAAVWTGEIQGYSEFQGHQTRQALALVERAAASVREQGLAAETATYIGDPRAAIVDEAKEWSADLVVMGSRGLTGLKRWLLGSVAQYVVGHAPCSVEVVRARSEASR